MGSLCSKSSHYQGGHIVLGTGANTTGGNPNSGNTTSGNTTSGGAPTSARDPRTAAAEAAERRMQAAQQRGTNSSNPKAGQLAAKVAQQNAKGSAEPQQPERLVWD
ncbi:hypothetical protein AGABI2DRAFT_133050 [Agaricus bisporus var. bisporus H97]|uniref:hypothetical protein n=1 Tax=Agaricus bisporus var. bisporus (strain H97 / ATCC MYA-4626 / FGSC 10389) TaxID=936046 RepID=UPI00029F5E66|nr:hypothetical protein AGABI2DRAFT_133050 [Agaricus bisporus var. bisporus H97]EKV51373.1 hypothetical protein AGABI2DRAFT_133050 [Agaricus bisporus var. bisporus H97]